MLVVVAPVSECRIGSKLELSVFSQFAFYIACGILACVGVKWKQRGGAGGGRGGGIHNIDEKVMLHPPYRVIF